MRSMAPILALAAALLLPSPAAADHHEAPEDAAPKAAEQEAPDAAAPSDAPDAAAPSDAPDAAAPKEWDSAQVAELAAALSKTAEDLRQMVRGQQAADNIASGQAYATKNVLDQLRALRKASNRLKLQVESGKGRDETLNVFRRIDEIRRDTAEALRRMFLAQAILDKIKEGRVLLEELRLFYAVKPDPRPDLVGPKKSDDQQ